MSSGDKSPRELKLTPQRLKPSGDESAPELKLAPQGMGRREVLFIGATPALDDSRRCAAGCGVSAAMISGDESPTELKLALQGVGRRLPFIGAAAALDDSERSTAGCGVSVAMISGDESPPELKLAPQGMGRRRFLFIGAAAALDDSIARVLGRALPAERFEYMLAPVGNRTVLAERWGDREQPAPLGSLVKPFVALAYAETRGFEFPRLRCRAGECWLAAGHGDMDIESALAHSCNAYFRELARNVSPESLNAVATRYAIPAPDVVSPETLIGRYGSWKAAPGAIASAYAELAARRSDPGVRTIMRGLRLCAESGTASGARARIAAKTGTAPCVHPRGSNGDGLIAALFPEQSPEYVLIVRGHGLPGAEVARSTAPFFRAVNHAR